MGKTKLKTNAVDDKRLTDKQRKFVCEYLLDYNGVRAAKAAGYQGNNNVLAVRANALIHHPLVSRIIGKAQRQDLERLELSREEILKQLFYLATRKASDFVDEHGELLPLNEMSDRAQSVIDGFEQEVHVDAETGDRTIYNKIRLSPKAHAVDMAMKHKGLFAPGQSGGSTVVINLESIYGIDAKMLESDDERIRRKAIEYDGERSGPTSSQIVDPPTAE